MERSLWRRGWDPGGIGGASESGKKGKDVKIIHKVNSSVADESTRLLSCWLRREKEVTRVTGFRPGCVCVGEAIPGGEFTSRSRSK